MHTILGRTGKGHTECIDRGADVRARREILPSGCGGCPISTTPGPTWGASRSVCPCLTFGLRPLAWESAERHGTTGIVRGAVHASGVGTGVIQAEHECRKEMDGPTRDGVAHGRPRSALLAYLLILAGLMRDTEEHGGGHHALLPHRSEIRTLIVAESIQKQAAAYAFHAGHRVCLVLRIDRTNIRAERVL